MFGWTYLVVLVLLQALTERRSTNGIAAFAGRFMVFKASLPIRVSR
jgi:hypothetical protein